MVENSVTSKTMFAQSRSTGFKWKIGCTVPKLAIKAISHAKKYLL